jgi:anti-anti-sigma factor
MGAPVQDPSDFGTPLLIQVDAPVGESTVLIRLSGEIDLATSPALERRLCELIGQGARTLVLDLGDVTFCDVTAMNTLLRVEAELRAIGGRLRLLGPCPWMSRMLSVLALNDRLQLEQVELREPTEADTTGG